MKAKKYFIAGYLLLTAVMLFSLANALTCNYDAEPHFDYKNPISWVCETNNATSCVSYIKENSQIIQTNPNIEYLKNIGEISAFECNAVCNIEFDTAMLKNNETYVFGVVCENNTFEQSVTPQLYFYEQQRVESLIWSKDYAYYLVGGFIALIFIGFILVFLIKSFRGY